MSLEHKLLKACEKGDLEEVKKLVEKGTNIHAQDDLALPEAAYYGHLDIVKYIVEQGTDIHALVLMWAESRGHTNVIDYLKSCIQKQERRKIIECL